MNFSPLPSSGLCFLPYSFRAWGIERRNPAAGVRQLSSPSKKHNLQASGVTPLTDCSRPVPPVHLACLLVVRLFLQLFMSYLSSFVLFALLGFMVSKKHQRRKDNESYLLSLHGGGGDDDDALENGSGNPSRKEYRGPPRGGGRRAPSMCEMVRRTLSRSAGGASQTSSFVDFGDFGDSRFHSGGGSGGGGYEDDDEMERMAFLDHRDGGTAETTSRSGLLGGAATETASADGGDGGFDIGARGGAARRPLVPRGRSAARGDGATGGGLGSGRKKRGAKSASASAAAASAVDYGSGGGVSSTKMR